MNVPQYHKMVFKNALITGPEELKKSKELKLCLMEAIRRLLPDETTIMRFETETYNNGKIDILKGLTVVEELVALFTEICKERNLSIGG